MGYRSHIEGEITFSRPLNRRERAQLTAIEDPWNVFRLLIEESERETDEGWATVQRCTGITGIEDEVKAYEWQRVLQELVNALPSDVTCSGYMQRTGEESPDLERLYVKDRLVVSVNPEITWPAP